MSGRRLGSFLAATAEPPRPPAEMLPKRERGLWSFLTWSFFLSQVLAGEAFVGARAHAAESLGSTSDSNPDGQTAAHSGQLAAFAGDLSAYAGASMGAGPHGNGGHPQLTISQVGLAHGATPHIALDAGSDSVLRVVGDGGGSGSAADGSAAAEADGDAGSVPVGVDLPDLLSDLGDTLSDVIGITVDDVVDPLLGAVGGLTQSLNAMVGNVVGDVGGLVGDVADLLDVGQTTQVVVGAVDDVVGALGSTVVDPLVQSLGSTTGHVLAPVLGTVDTLLHLDTGSTGGGPSHALGPVAASILTPAIAPVADVLASAGDIVFPNGSAIGPDSLFLDGRYTDYNLALRTTVTGDASAVGNLVQVVPGLLEHLVVAADGHASQDAQHIGALPSLLDDIGVRGLGDGIV